MHALNCLKVHRYDQCRQTLRSFHLFLDAAGVPAERDSDGVEDAATRLRFLQIRSCSYSLLWRDVPGRVCGSRWPATFVFVRWIQAGREKIDVLERPRWLSWRAVCNKLPVHPAQEQDTLQYELAESKLRHKFSILEVGFSRGLKSSFYLLSFSAMQADVTQPIQ